MTIRLRVRRGLRRARSRCAPGARPVAAGWRPATPSAAAVSPRARCPRSSARRCGPAWTARDRVRTRLPTDDAAAAAASGATSVVTTGGGSVAGSGSVAAPRDGAVQVKPVQPGQARAPSWQGPAPARRRRPAAPAGGPPSAAGASSSLRIRRIEARMSSIDGIAAGRAGRCLRFAHRNRLLSGPAGRSRSRRDRPTCSSPHCSRRSRHTTAPADADRSRSAARSPRPPGRTR